MITVHVTDRRTFKECRRKFSYSVIQRLTTAEKNIDHFYVGTAGHYALAGFYEECRSKPKEAPDPQPHWFEFTTSQKKQPNAEVEELSLTLLKRYVQHYGHTEFSVVAVEVPIKLAYPEFGFELQGTLDLIVEDKNGLLWIVDHKFLKRLPDQKVLEMDDQMTAYIWLAHKAGFNVKGAIYNVIRKALPVEPELLQRGNLSKRKLADLTYETYLAAIERYQLDRDDYEDILSELQCQENTFFQRSKVTRNKKELALFELNLMAELRDMSSPELVYYPNPGDRCKTCIFQQLCKCENEGGEGRLLREEYYRIKEYDER